MATETAAPGAAQQALGRTEERTQYALDAGGVGIWEYEHHHAGALTWSATLERIHGLAPGTFGRTRDSFYACVHPEDRARVRDGFERAVTRRTPFGLEYRALWPDGTVGHIVMKGRYFAGTAGVLSIVGGVAIDTTERRALEAQLLQSQKMEAIGLLAGGVSHDFNNLLTAILGYGELLEPLLTTSPQGTRDLEHIRKSALRAAGLTRQLLAFSRRQLLRPTVIDLNALVSELANMLRRLIGEELELRLLLDPDLPVIKADPGQIEQVIVNLAVNARDAMPRGGILTIATAKVSPGAEFLRRHALPLDSCPGEMVRLAVTDTGTGIDDVTRKRIFEPFFTTKPRGKGSGLGLATVYGIVKQSGGLIAVDTAPDHGTTFEICFPRAPGTAAPAAPSPVPAAASPRGSETILLVEDEYAVRSLMRTVLEAQGYRVIDADDAQAAARLADEYGDRIDLLVSDVVLPGESGPELFERLARARPGVRVLFVSGYSDERIVAAGILAADAPYLEKPFTGRLLTQKVRDVLDAPPS